MADTIHTLEVQASLDDKASRKLEKMGATGKKAGDTTTKSLKNTEKQAKNTSRSLTDAGQSGAKAAGIIGAGFSSVSAGITAANATAENFEESMIGAGAAVAGAFGAGGPVGGALALASIGIGLLIGKTREAGQAAKEASKAFEEGMQRSRDAIVSSTDALEQLNFEIKVMSAELAGVDFDIGLESLENLADKQAEVVEKSKRALLDAEAKATDAVRARQRALEDLNRASQGTEYLLTASIQERLALAEKEFSVAQEAVSVRRQELENNAAILSGFEKKIQIQVQLNKRAAEEAEQAEVLAAGQKIAAQAAQERLDTNAENVEVTEKELEVRVDIGKAIDAEGRAMQRKADIAQREAERVANVNRSLDDRLAILNATTDRERLLVKLSQERRDLIESGAEAAKVELLVKKQIADFDEASTEAVEKQAGLAVTKASAAGRAARAQRADVDVTKEFKSAPASGGLFGFGAGRVGFGGFYGGQSRARKSQAGGAASDMPDAAPAIEAAAGAMKGIGENYKRFVQAVDKMASSTKQTLEEVGAVTVDAVAKVAGYVSELRSEVKTLKRQLEAATSLGVAGE